MALAVGHTGIPPRVVAPLDTHAELHDSNAAGKIRYHPAVVAQAFMTLEASTPGRAYLGIGSGESLNETPCGMDWPPVREQVDRMEEALEIIGRLFDGERLDYDGRFFRTKRALLHTRAERRPPIYVSAFGPRAAQIAARLRRPVDARRSEMAPDVIDAYKGACEDAGKDPESPRGLTPLPGVA